MSGKMGICNICGDYKELSKEHVPPRSAFNKGRWTQYLYSDNQWAENPLILPNTKRIYQGGVKFSTICGKCNNNTGGWYAGSFSDWCHYSMDILKRAKGKTSLFIPNELYPLKIAKQIITMFFAINDSDFRKRHPKLVKFVLDKRCYPLPDEYKIWAYFKIDENLRYISESYIGNFKKGPKPIMITEIAFPPFGFLLTSPVYKEDIDHRLTNITHFSYFKFEEKRHFDLRLPTLPTVINIAGDFRSKSEIEEAIRNSKASRNRDDL
ncbi:hypothetical protein [Algoriphagus sp. Y33]|uniref:hypothetical protein n=1 Tax=Algoriphagus sp. Y33 TaxID=2772483 RepID=UPI00177BC010|nr:hypothetical protein [Algoriphagus sp. Y33]